MTDLITMLIAKEVTLPKRLESRHFNVRNRDQITETPKSVRT